MSFVFDTNSIRVLGNYYPDSFPSLWTEFDRLVREAEVVSVREVLRELHTQLTQPWLKDWVSKNKPMFLTPGDSEAQLVTEIFKVDHFRALIGQKQILRGSPVADPWLVACGKILDGAVVTEEADKPNAAKVPNVCDHLGVRHINLERFMSDHGWRF